MLEVLRYSACADHHPSIERRASRELFEKPRLAATRFGFDEEQRQATRFRVAPLRQRGGEFTVPPQQRRAAPYHAPVRSESVLREVPRAAAAQTLHYPFRLGLQGAVA